MKLPLQRERNESEVYKIETASVGKMKYDNRIENEGGKLCV
jgi:hypothetical protein